MASGRTNTITKVVALNLPDMEPIDPFPIFSAIVGLLIQLIHAQPANSNRFILNFLYVSTF